MCMSSSKGREHPELPEPLKTKLKDFYQPWNDMFYRAIKHKFDWK